MQVIGVGAQDDFTQALDFLEDTGVGDSSALTMLFEQTGAIWRTNQVTTNSSLQLFSHDLTEQSQLIWFNDSGRDVVLDAATQEPWAPAQ